MKLEPNQPAWYRSEDELGHIPADFTPSCEDHPEARCVMRFGTVRVQRDGLAVHNIGYKCTQCGGIEKFFVKTDMDYALKIVEMRKGSRSYVPDAKEWAKEDIEITERLKALGYI